MKRKIITISTNKNQQIVDITQEIKYFVAENVIKNCIVTIRTLHTTTAVYINENEPGLLQDVLVQLSHTLPPNYLYHHDSADERKNGSAHLQAILLNTDITLSVINQQLILGTYQSVLFVELDGPRNNRQVELLLYAEDIA